MTQHTINLTDPEQATLVAVTAKVNQTRATEGLPPITETQFLTNRVKNQLDGMRIEAEQAETTSLKDAYLAASPATRTTVRTALGL